ncbi:MAG: thiamine pyrophosphate-binding protein [Alphaproteobacteria bacterium]|nr:thiamine pyrophosphate-binding protein [Alphaproteobacteria bacterium]
MTSPSPQARIADLVAGTLHAYGIRHAFGIPGGEVLTLVDALRLAGIRFVLTRHETPAAFMAAGANAIANTPGVLVTTLGPGLANAVNAIADASQEHVPLIVVSGVVDHDIRHRYTHQVLDHAKLLNGIVKDSFEIESDGAAATTARAIELALTPPFGPVHIDLAPGTAIRPASPGEIIAAPPQEIVLPPSDDDAGLVNLADLLGKAKRPLLLAGFEAARQDAGPEVLQLCERLNAPLMTTYKAKGLVDEDHALCLGGAGLSPLADKSLKEILSAADLIVLAGYDPIEMRQGWLDPFHDDQTVIDLQGAPCSHAMHRCDVRVSGPLKATLAAIATRIEPRTESWPQGEPAKAHTQLTKSFAAPADWGAHAVFETLQEMADADAVITVDSGAHRILLCHTLRMHRPLRLLQSAGFCTMGIALPMAAGVKAVAPNETVIAVLGDGGLEMGIGELATLRDEGLNITVLVLQDESLALIELKQKKLAFERCGVGLGKTRFEDIATAFGGHGVRVSSRGSLLQELKSAATRQTFSVIVCDIEATDYIDRI